MNAVHIDDVVAGHLAAETHGRTAERYILGGENLSIARLLTITAEVVGRRPTRLVVPAGLVLIAPGAARRLEGWLRLPIGGDLLTLTGHNFFNDLSKARGELGLPAPKSYRLAAEQAIAWCREHRLL